MANVDILEWSDKRNKVREAGLEGKGRKGTFVFC